MTAPDPRLDAIQAIPAEAVCASNIHEPPVSATVHGSFTSPWNPANNSADVWYCQRCATAGEAMGVFMRNEVEA